MSQPVNQVKAALALSRYSLLATLRSPTSIVFSLLFPIIFITVFGSINPGKPLVMKLAVKPGCDTGNPVFKAIKAIDNVSLIQGLSVEDLKDDLNKGRIAAILDITPDTTPTNGPHYMVHLQAAASGGKASICWKQKLMMP